MIYDRGRLWYVVFVYHVSFCVPRKISGGKINPPQKNKSWRLSSLNSALVGMTATIGFPFTHRVFEWAQLRPMLKR